MQPIGDSHLEAIDGAKRGFGGSCLPKDMRALFVDLRDRGVDFRLIGAVLDDNERLRED
jgi:UDP-glucose 6-dehydrogenase